MLRPRVIPFLMIENGALVKTTRFGNPVYVGDPLNAVRIFNEKEVDELVVADVSATSERREPNFKMIGELARECRMPLCYVGGVSSPEQVERIISIGVEKVGLCSAALSRPELIMESGQKVGRQSIVVVIDAKKIGPEGAYVPTANRGQSQAGFSVATYAAQAEALGAGEILVNGIDSDGVMAGYDFNLIDQVWNSVRVPVTALGGAGSFQHISDLVARYGTIGAAAGSLFVFKGKFRAVLVNYLRREQRDDLVRAVAARP
jgi:cyclase